MAPLRAEHPLLVVVSAFRGYGADESMTGFNAYDPAWIDGLTRLVQQLRSIGAKVLVLGLVPDPHFDVPTCLSAHLDDVTACLPHRSSAVSEPGIAAESAAAKVAGGQYADVTDLFCTVDRCPVIVGKHVDLCRLGSPDLRILPAVGTGNGGAGGPRARPRLTSCETPIEQACDNASTRAARPIN